MRLALIISLIFVAIFGLLLFLAFSDFQGKSSCTTPLTDCVKTCEQDNFIKGSTCVFSCSFANVKCLASSLWTD